MSATTSFAVIADSSRLGRQLLKKILEPLVAVDTLATTNSIAEAFDGDSTPTLLLISYDWPDIEAELDQLKLRAPHAHVVILASPDQHETTKSLNNRPCVMGAITKPYQSRDVTHYLVHALQGAVQRAPQPSSTTLDHNIPLSVMLERDLAFCKRHGLMLSAMAVQINEHQSLCAEVGKTAVNNAQASLEKKMRALLRHEDSICLRQPGLIALSLPGTPPLGARVLAHRLCAWIGQEEFRHQHFNIHFSVNIGIHCCVPGTEVDTQDFLRTTANTTQEVPENGENHIHLSDYARAITGEKTDSAHDKRRPDSAHFWHTLEALLHHPDLNDSEHQDALLSRLGPILSNLSETQRMKLIDQLLVASVNPGT
tara:strand:- start:26403 stop:27509 length:1107 start_codon:yes stop_codon:yes gene_type:complete